MNKVLVFSVAILSVQRALGDAVDQKIENILRKLNLTQYEPTLDKTFPLNELKTSLDEMATGPCRPLEPRLAMFKLYYMGYKLVDDHIKATDTFVTWCIKADYIFRHYEKLDMKMDAVTRILDKLWEAQGEYGAQLGSLEVAEMIKFQTMSASNVEINLQRNIFAYVISLRAEADELKTLRNNLAIPWLFTFTTFPENFKNLLPQFSGDLQKFIKRHGGSPWLDNGAHLAL